MPNSYRLSLLTFILSIYFFHSSDANVLKPKPKGKFQTLVIDAGHGGKDPGTIGSFMQEKQITLAVTLKLQQLMKQYLPEVKTILTRDNDKFLELEDRAQFANKNKADFFISIHVNAAAKRDVKKKKDIIIPHIRGAETYVMGINNEGRAAIAKRENSAMLLEDNYKKTYNGFDPESDEAYIIMSNFTSSNVDQSASMASKIQGEYKHRCGLTDKGVHRQSIWVLWRTEMPAVLTELGYITNLDEEKFLGSELGQNYLATSIFIAIRKYKDELEGNVKKYNDEIELLAPFKGDKTEFIEMGDKTNLDAQKLNNSSLIKKSESDTNKPSYISEEIAKNDSKAESLEGNSKAEKSEAEVKANFEKLLTANRNPDYEFKVQIEVTAKQPDFKLEKYKSIEQLEYLESGPMFKVTSGNFKSLSEAAMHQKKMREMGFPQAFVITIKNGKRIQ